MRVTRFFWPGKLALSGAFQLDENISNHILRVLRLKPHDRVILFDGLNHEFLAEIVGTNQKLATVKILDSYSRSAESPVNIHLLQGIARGEKMDLIIQKAVELGVNEITPIFTQHCNVKLDEQKIAGRIDHWQKIAISACEQCGRNEIPQINAPQNLLQWIGSNKQGNGLRLILNPNAKQGLVDLNLFNGTETMQNCSRRSLKIILLIGPEGGLSADEIELCTEHDFYAVRLGPRILRTETAALATISAIQALWGDFI